MLRIAIRSGIILIVSALGASAAVFWMLRMLPGDIALLMLGDHATPEAVATLRAQLGIGQRSAVGQYFDWLTGVLRGDFGTTRGGRVSVLDEIRKKAAVTVSVAIPTFVFSAVGALLVGTYAALHSDKWRGRVVDGATLFGIAVPSFWVGMLLIRSVSVGRGWLPVGGYVPWSESVTGALRSLALPVLTLSISLGAVFTRYVRAAMIDTFNQDYVRAALSRGRTLRSVAAVHCLRNASIPLVTVAMLALGGLLTGMVVVEMVFNLPGLGRMLLEAVGRRDIVVVQSVVLIMLLIILCLNFVMDILYGVLDPRIRDAARRPR